MEGADASDVRSSSLLPPLPAASSRPASPSPFFPPPRSLVIPICSEGGLQFVGDLMGHEGMLREVHFCLPDQPALLHSCAADGTVRGWDARSGQQVER